MVWLSLFDNDSLPDHLSWLLFDLLVLDGNFLPSMLDWKDCGVCLDVILPCHVSDAVKTVGEQCLKISGTVNSCGSWLQVDGG